jgi:hypothetical protein
LLPASNGLPGLDELILIKKILFSIKWLIVVVEYNSEPSAPLFIGVILDILNIYFNYSGPGSRIRREFKKRRATGDAIQKPVDGILIAFA